MDADKEYNKLLTQLYGRNDESLYQDLMNKEQDVLDVVSRVANSKREADTAAGQFVHMPLVAVMQRFYQVIVEVAAEASKAKSLHGLVLAVRKGDRVIYAGIFVVAVALFLLLLQGN